MSEEKRRTDIDLFNRSTYILYAVQLTPTVEIVERLQFGVIPFHHLMEDDELDEDLRYEEEDYTGPSTWFDDDNPHQMLFDKEKLKELESVAGQLEGHSLNEAIRHRMRQLTEVQEAVDPSAKGIKEIGQFLYKLIPEEIRKIIATRKMKNLVIATSLYFLPYDLAHDGEDFFCFKYNVSRLLMPKEIAFAFTGGIADDLEFVDLFSFALGAPKTTEKGWDSWIEFGDSEFDVIIVESNPGSDLALAETKFLQEFLEPYNVNLKILRGQDATKTRFLQLLRNTKANEIIHFAGHGHFDSENPDHSGLRFIDGILTAKEIEELGGGGLFNKENSEIKGRPLVFVNACESATVKIIGEGSGEGIAHAFLRAGVGGYIGPLWPVRDDIAADFATKFYTLFLKEKAPVAQAIRESKKYLQTKYSGIAWANYNYYGNPLIRVWQKIDPAQDES